MKIFFFIIIAFIFFTACQKDVNLNLPSPASELVVEGTIETGQPPIIVLTTNSPYFGTTNTAQLAQYLVHGANVRVYDGTDTVTLNEINFDTAGIQFSAYTTLSMVGQVGKTYQLWINAKGTNLSSTTSILAPTPLDSIWWVKDSLVSGRDSLVQLWGKYSDPPQFGNCVRFFTKVNSKPYLTSFTSVFNDDFINGKTFNSPIPSGILFNDTASQDNWPDFVRGDTITVKWCAIDLATFNFWRTLETELGSEGNPFASPIDVEGNIKNGLGIWSGYSTSFMTIIVPQK
jgi:hypothetical protein